MSQARSTATNTPIQMAAPNNATNGAAFRRIITPAPIAVAARKGNP
ncbi:MAG: hypothetical protein JWP07_1748 [Pseudonocardiales bacterium]|nr:hypothetical protein [Pseudonocardiales bacterium]